jgi:hypothetical protein
LVPHLRRRSSWGEDNERGEVRGHLVGTEGSAVLAGSYFLNTLGLLRSIIRAFRKRPKCRTHTQEETYVSASPPGSMLTADPSSASNITTAYSATKR